MKSVAVIGAGGFIGLALSTRLTELGYEVTEHPREDNKIIFYFAGPTHLQFEESPTYHYY